MNEDKNPAKGETAAELLASIDRLAEAAERKKKISSDADIIRTAINLFISNLNTEVSRVFRQEQEKGTRTDLVVTMVIGGLAYTLAKVFFLINKLPAIKMSAKEFEATFLGMFKSAVQEIGKAEK